MPRSFLVKNKRAAIFLKKTEKPYFGCMNHDCDFQGNDSLSNAFVEVSSSWNMETKMSKSRTNSYKINELDAGKRFDQRQKHEFGKGDDNYEMQNLNCNGRKVCAQYDSIFPRISPQIDLKALFLNTIPITKPFGMYYTEKQSDTKEMMCNVRNVPLQLDANQQVTQKLMPRFKGPLPQSNFNCKLCKMIFTDAFSLAQHKCAGIKLVEHRCPECDKVFSCPANLASHRRWHRPRSPTTNKPIKENEFQLKSKNHDKKRSEPIGLSSKLKKDLAVDKSIDPQIPSMPYLTMSLDKKSKLSEVLILRKYSDDIETSSEFECVSNVTGDGPRDSCSRDGVNSEFIMRENLCKEDISLSAPFRKTIQYTERSRQQSKRKIPINFSPRAFKKQNSNCQYCESSLENLHGQNMSQDLSTSAASSDDKEDQNTSAHDEKIIRENVLL